MCHAHLLDRNYPNVTTGEAKANDWFADLAVEILSGCETALGNAFQEEPE